jgi:hypothetical protein
MKSHTQNTTIDINQPKQTKQAVRDYVGPDRYEYFTFKVTDPEADLTVSVTPFTGGGCALILLLCGWRRERLGWLTGWLVD